MNMDIAAHLGAVARVVEDRQHNGEAVKVVVATRRYDTGVEDLWDAVTNPERLPRWFAQVDGDLKLGGRFQVRNNAGGAITACDPPRSLSLTWEFGGGVSWVNVRLAPAGEGAQLTLEHLQPVTDHWKTYGPGATGVGWELGLLGLGMHIRSGVSRESFDEHAWGASEEGKDFVRQAGEGWIAADIAGGEDPSDATGRGRRTIAFYRGEAPPGG